MKPVLPNYDPALEAVERRSRFLRTVSLVLGVVFGLALIGAVWLTIQQVTTPNIILAAVLAVAAGMNVAAFFLARSRPRLEGWLNLLSVALSVLLFPLFFQGSGLIASLAAYLFILWFGDRAFGRRLQNWILIGAPLLIAGAFALDYYGDIGRIEPLSTLYQYSIIALLLVVIVAALINRFGELPFRIKVVGAFILVSAISVAAVAILSVLQSSQSLSTAGSLALISAARSTARSVDTFFVVMRTRAFSEAQLPAVRTFMELRQPTTEQREEILVTMNTLASQEMVVSSTQTNYLDFVRRYMLVNERGLVVIDTTLSRLGLSVADTDYFQPAMITDAPYASPVIFNRDGTTGLYFSARINGNDGTVQGVLIIEIDPAVLQNIILDNNNQVGDQSYATLVDDNSGLRLAQGAAPAQLFRVLTPLDLTETSRLQEEGFLPAGFLQNLSSDETELGRLLSTTAGAVDDLEFSRGERSEGDAYFGAIASLETRPWRVVYAQTQEYVLAPVQTQIQITIALAAVIGLAAAGAALVIGQLLVRPVADLTNLAKSIAAGDLQVRAPVGVRDEIGTLAESLNSMADQLQLNISGLEQRVAERTSALERRNQQLQAATEIGRYVSTIRDQDELLRRSVRLISERFDFYHAGIFLIDNSGRFAVLSAANSDGGQRMLARGHRLAVGQQGIVGYVTGTGEPRIALDVGSDAVFFNNPDLPTTRSEMALPLRSGGHILGALDVQSTQPQAFSQEDVSTLQVLADLLSVAIDNARLLHETENALSSIRQAYGEVSQRSWIERIAASTLVGAELGFVASDRGITALSRDTRFKAGVGLAPEDKGAGLSLPIRVRDTVIGTVDVLRPGVEASETDFAWNEEQVELLNTLVDQLGVALEGARLYESSQLQAERERLVSDVSARIQESLDVDAVLRAAALEIRKALDLSDVTIVLDPAASMPAVSTPPAATAEEVSA